MAGPIKISILADAGKAIKEVTKFSEIVDSETKRVVTTLGDSKLQGSFGKVQEGFDVAEQRATGFRDTITGLQDGFKGVQAFMGQGEAASASFGDKLLLLGTGVGDLASGFANFLVPMAAVVSSTNALSLASIKATAATAAQKVATVASTAAQWLLNAALTANPIGLVILAIVALVAIFVIAYKKSETFRRIVDAAFKGVLNAAKAAWNWVKRNWPLLLAIITGPIGLAVRAVVKHWDTIVSKAKAIPGFIKGAFKNANTFLVSAGRRIVEGLWNGVKALNGWIAGKVRSFISDNVTGPIRNALKIFSPSRVMRDIGKYIPQGLALGIKDASDKVRNATANMTAATIPAVGSVNTSAGGSVQIVFESNGDPFMDAIWTEFQKRIRVRGGNVQVALGR